MKSAPPHPAVVRALLDRALHSFYLRGVHTRARYAREWQDFLATLRQRHSGKVAAA